MCCTLYAHTVHVVPLILHSAVSVSIPVDADPKVCFKVGQVVACRVVSCDSAEEKLQLSLEVSSRPPGRWVGCVRGGTVRVCVQVLEQVVIVLVMWTKHTALKVWEGQSRERSARLHQHLLPILPIVLESGREPYTQTIYVLQ